MTVLSCFPIEITLKMFDITRKIMEYLKFVKLYYK